MRILHTSDWHLGKTLHGLDLLEEQRTFVQQIVAAVDEQDIDCVLIAGDVFDKGVPPVGAVRLYSDALTQLADRCAVVVTSGNHDSAIRLGAGSSLFRAGVHVATDPATVGEQFDLHVKGVHVRIFPVPYLDPDHCRTIFSDSEPLPRSHEAVMTAAIRRIWEHDSSLAIEPTARLVVAHAFVSGGKKSESERDISVGGVDAVSATVFDNFDYVALGHLHGPQSLTVAGTIRYSGSPMRYSFSEEHHNKSVTIIDISPSGVTHIQTMSLGQPREMASLRGTLAQVMSLDNISAHSQSWVRVVITDTTRPRDLVEQVKAAYPHALSVIHEPIAAIPTQAIGPRAIDLRDPVSVSADFISAVTANDPTAAEVSVLREVYDAARQRTYG